MAIVLSPTTNALTNLAPAPATPPVGWLLVYERRGTCTGVPLATAYTACPSGRLELEFDLANLLPVASYTLYVYAQDSTTNTDLDAPGVVKPAAYVFDAVMRAETTLTTGPLPDLCTDPCSPSGGGGGEFECDDLLTCTLFTDLQATAAANTAAAAAAQADATQAQADAASAEAAAQQAQADATQALQDAAAADAAAQQAQSDATQALQDAATADATAQQAQADAVQALQDAATAQQAADDAQADATQALVETAANAAAIAVIQGQLPPAPPAFDGSKAVDLPLNGFLVSDHTSSMTGLITTYGWAFSLWMRATPPAGTTILPFIHTGIVNQSGEDFLYVDLRSGALVLYQHRIETDSDSFLSGATGINGTTWTHIVVQYDPDGTSPGNGRMEVWANGVLAGSRAQTWDDHIVAGNSRPWYFGGLVPSGSSAQPNVTAPYVGEMTQISIYEQALASAEITAIYNGGTPTDLELLASAPKLRHWWDPAYTCPAGTIIYDRVDCARKVALWLNHGASIVNFT